MLPRLQIFPGQRFGRWTIVREVPSRKYGKQTQRYFHCVCACGNAADVALSNLKGGYSVSCGCAALRHGHARRIGYTKVYRAWADMLNRCFCPSNKRFDDWGGRGISVCERWREFENFLADMGESPLGHSLDRIDNDGNYEPGNCRWATAEQQQNNRRPF